MTESTVDIQSLVKSIDHLVNNMEELLKYVYCGCSRNKFLKNDWKQLCYKVSHGVILTISLRSFVNNLSNNQGEIDKLKFSLSLTKRLGFCTLLIWEIYKLMYTNWLKHLLEPSIMHKGTYPTEKKIEELKNLQIFANPEQIDVDTHEIARRVAKFKTQFDVYNSYTLFGMLAEAKTIVYLGYNQDRYVSVEKDRVDPDNKVNFTHLGKAIEILAVWRAQFAHFGNYLLRCEEIFDSAHKKCSSSQFDQFKKEIISEFSSRSSSFIKYLDRLFWKIGEAIQILSNACQNIDEIFNYKLDEI